MYVSECGMGYKSPVNQYLMTQCDFTVEKKYWQEYCEFFILDTITMYTSRTLQRLKKKEISVLSAQYSDVSGASSTLPEQQTTSKHLPRVTVRQFTYKAFTLLGC